LIPIERIEPYYKIALKAAKESPCTRRKYGAVIGYDSDPIMVTGTNARVSGCCDGYCVRDRAGVVNGSRTELGAEVHAEQAALINAPKRGEVFVLAGWQVQNGFELTELKGTAVYPCLVCARMIKYAGYRWVHMKNFAGNLDVFHIDDIITAREMELGPHYE